MENTPIRGQGVEAHEESVELRRHLNIIRSRFWTIFASVVVVFSIAAIHTFRATPVYESSARLLVERRLPEITPFDGAQERRDPGYYQTQAQLITSRAVLEEALKNPEVAAIFQDRSELPAERPDLLRAVLNEVRSLFSEEPTRPLEPWERLRGRVESRPLRDTDLVDVRVAGTNPKECALIANAVAEAYVDYSIALRQRTALDAFDTLQSLKEEQEEVLNQAEAALYRFKEEAASSESGGLGGADDIQQRLRTLNGELTRVQMRRMELNVEAMAARRLREELEGNPEKIMALAGTLKEGATAEALKALRELELRQRESQSVYGPKHPSVIAIEEQRQALLQLVTDGLFARVDALETEHELLHEKEKEIDRALTELNRVALELTRASIGSERLERDVERQSEVFDVLLDRMRQVDLTKDTGVTNIRVVEQASVPTRPFRPNRQRSLAVGLMLGLMLGLGLAYLHEWMDDTVKTPDDIEHRLDMPVLGLVPEMQSNGVAGDGFPGMALHTLNSPFSPTSEAYRSIRTNLYFSGSREESRAIVVTSPGPDEGKTVTACNLAITLAQDGRRILLVDSDLRRPKIHVAFGLKRSPGLTNILVEGREVEDVVTVPEDPDGKKLENLHVLCAGSKTPNPAELVGGEAMRRFMEDVREKYDMVIYDSGAAMLVADATLIAGRCDGAVMIVKAGSSRRNIVNRLRRHFEMAQCRLVGAVLNDVRPGFLRGSYSYGYYYGYGYGYGYGYSHGYYQEEDGEEEE